MERRWGNAEEGTLSGPFFTGGNLQICAGVLGTKWVTKSSKAGGPGKAPSKTYILGSIRIRDPFSDLTEYFLGTVVSAGIQCRQRVGVLRVRLIASYLRYPPGPVPIMVRWLGLECLAGWPKSARVCGLARFCGHLRQFCALIPRPPACGNPVNELCGPCPRFLEFLLAACRGFGENHVRRIGPG